MELSSFDFPMMGRNLFKRCATCPDTPPSCPACAPGECIGGGSAPSAQTSTPTSTGQKSSGSVAGPIAGGVIGGIVVVMIITYLVWRFCIKKRREEFDQNEWRQSMAAKSEKQDDAFTTQRDARASTHTVGSIASTVLTRASNIIQIAYIPGVTNRSVESSPDLLIPPVPPIPAASPSMSAVSSPQPGQQDQHYFMPADLRDSAYSGYSADDRTSYARSSMTPSMMRNSVATTAYRNNAVINPVPAQKIIRGKATAVSLKSNEKNSPIDTPRSATPPMPTVDARIPSTFNPTNTNSPIVARLGTPKAVTVTRSPSNNYLKTSSPLNPAATKSPSPIISENSQRPSESRQQRRVSIQAPSQHDANSSTFDDASSSDEDVPSPQEQSLMGHGRKLSGSKSSVSPMSWQSPFKSPSSAPDLRHDSPFKPSASSSPDLRAKERQQNHKRSGSLNQIIEEATRRASREPRHGGLGSVGSIMNTRKDGQGPFSDEHAARTP
ncbi:MAG: hypothetical protein LQ338_004809 [Usnochroma carphineum]|nr:MAG: hypothetical protein LQ338_004809 [Usnochroma carphineum]